MFICNVTKEFRNLNRSNVKIWTETHFIPFFNLIENSPASISPIVQWKKVIKHVFCWKHPLMFSDTWRGDIFRGYHIFLQRLTIWQICWNYMFYWWNNALKCCPFLMPFLYVSSAKWSTRHIPNINPFEMNSWKICCHSRQKLEMCKDGWGEILEAFKKPFQVMQVQNFDEEIVWLQNLGKLIYRTCIIWNEEFILYICICISHVHILFI